MHRRELINQAFRTLSEANQGHRSASLAAGVWRIRTRKCWSHLFSRLAPRHIQEPGTIFVDEAHHVRANSWENLLAKWPDAQVIGLTATPSRLDGKGLHTHFDEMVNGPSVAALTEESYLAPIQTLVPSRSTVIGWRRDKSKVTVAHAVKAYKEHATGRKAIFFGWNVEHSQSRGRIPG